MSLLLNVPYAEKDDAKSLGARWNPQIKKWYVQSLNDYPKFYKWMPLPNDEVCHILCNHIFVVAGMRYCYKCGKATRVMGFGIEDYFEVIDPSLYAGDLERFTYHTGVVHIVSELPHSIIPKLIWDFLEQEFHYKMGYSKQGGHYYANHCQHCDAIQGYFPLFCEPDSPLVITNYQDAQNLILYHIKLKNDLIVGDIPVQWGSEDYLIKQHASIKQTHLEI